MAKERRWGPDWFYVGLIKFNGSLDFAKGRMVQLAYDGRYQEDDVGAASRGGWEELGLTENEDYVFLRTPEGGYETHTSTYSYESRKSGKWIDKTTIYYFVQFTDPRGVTAKLRVSRHDHRGVRWEVLTGSHPRKLQDLVIAARAAAVRADRRSRD